MSDNGFLQVLQVFSHFNVLYRSCIWTLCKAVWWSGWLVSDCLKTDCEGTVCDETVCEDTDCLSGCLLDCLLDFVLCGNKILWPKFPSCDSMWKMWLLICISLKPTEAPSMYTWRSIWEQTMKQRTKFPI